MFLSIAQLLESDSIAHSVYQPGSQAIYDVVELFGDDILLPDKPKGQEEIDRKKLGAIVFGDPKKMKVRTFQYGVVCVFQRLL